MSVLVGICCDTCNVWYHIHCQGMSTYKTGSITASLLLLTSLFYYHVVTYKQITADFMIYDQFIKTLLQRSVEL